MRTRFFNPVAIILLSIMYLSACHTAEHGHSHEHEHADGQEHSHEHDHGSDRESDHDKTDGYNADLAARLGADDYGMKVYVMALLKSGPNRPQDSVKSAELQRAHLDNITRLAEEGKLVMAGPMMGDRDLRGIYVFDVRTLEEAKALTETDPAIQHGSLVMELHEWYSSAAVMQIPEIHKQVAKLNP